MGVVLLRSGNVGGLRLPELFSSGGGGGVVKRVSGTECSSAEWRKSDSEENMRLHPWGEQ